MKYKGYLLDEFQEKAIKYIEDDESVVVSAPTGSGKTLIADYLINKYVGSSYRVVYTAPIKALSNQKYTEFSEAYGKENIGLVTGDTVINPLAQIVIMTTEIYRNMLLAKDPSILDIKFVIFDEIHYMSDIERGTVWEESIIFSPPHIRFLCLSATIPNRDIFARWIQDIKKHKVKVVAHHKRAVPLTFHLFDNGIVKLDTKEINKRISIRTKQSKAKKKKDKKKSPEIDPYKAPLALAKSLASSKMVPAIFFLFSRRQVEDFADHIYKKVDFLSKAEQEEIKIIIKNNGFDERASEYNIKHYDIIKKYLMKGIAIHHAGLFPMIKDLVETLFAKGLVKVLFATETFAVGINMPAKTVVFNSLRKFDGYTFRSIHSQEFYQMAGRAGRRSIDKEGNVLVMFDDSTDLFALKRIMKTESEPVISQFKLSYNTILNLVKNHNDEEIEIILKSNFDYYVKKSEQNIRIMASYNAKLKNLIELGFVQYADQVSDEFYIEREGVSYVLTEKGKFASKIYAHELLITELFFTGFYSKFTLAQINMLISAIVYEPRKSDSFSISKKNKYVYEEALIKLRDNEFLYSKINKKALYRLFSMIYLWSNKADFAEIMKYTNQQEGDVIRQFKQIIDFLRQIRRATEDFELASVIDQARLLIDRDIINMTL